MRFNHNSYGDAVQLSHPAFLRSVGPYPEFSQAMFSNWLGAIILLILLVIGTIVGSLRQLPVDIPSDVVFGAIVTAFTACYRHVHINMRTTIGACGRGALAVLFVTTAGALLVSPARPFTAPAAALHMLYGATFVGALLSLNWLTKRVPRLGFIPVPFLAAIGAFSSSGAILRPCLQMTEIDLAWVADLPLMRIDQLLGLSRLIHAAQHLGTNPQLYLLLLLIYAALPIVIAIAAGAELIYARNSGRSLLLQILVGSCIGYSAFFLVPAIGPAYYFSNSYPWHLPTALEGARWTLATAMTPRNCLPSLHATFAILSALALRQTPRWQQVLGGLFVLLTFAATSGLGEHYGIDWVVAVPLVLLVRGLCALTLPATHRTRLACVIAGFALIMSWVLTIRWSDQSLDHAAFIRPLALASILAPILLERALARDERRAQVQA